MESDSTFLRRIIFIIEYENKYQQKTYHSWDNVDISRLKEIANRLDILEQMKKDW